MRLRSAAWLLIPFTVFAAIVGTQAQPSQPWKTYKPDGARFSVDMPGAPTVASVPVPVGGGSFVAMTEATAAAGPAAYIASYVDYPASVTRGAAASVILTQVRNGSAAGNTVRDEKKLELGRAEGREYTVVQANGKVAVSRIYWLRGRLYQLVVDGPAGIERQPETRRFLESFSLTAP